MSKGKKGKNQKKEKFFNVDKFSRKHYKDALPRPEVISSNAYGSFTEFNVKGGKTKQEDRLIWD